MLTLVDECVNPAIIKSYVEHFGWAAHVKHLGIDGMNDRKLYNLSYGHAYDLIISRDQKKKEKTTPLADSPHLTVRALVKGIRIMDDFSDQSKSSNQTVNNRSIQPWHAPDLARVPLVVHVLNVTNTSEEIVPALLAHRDNLFLAVEYGITPYVTIKGEDFLWGPTFKRINLDTTQINKGHIVESSRDARAKKMANKIVQGDPRKYSDEVEASLLQRKAKLWVKKIDG